MIETEQTVLVRTDIGAAWSYASDIRRWASLVPGMQECEIIDGDSSRWVVKVGVGGLVRTVTVDVRVIRWAGPAAVDFTFKVKGDPVTGGGSYRAVTAPGGTALALVLRVEGTGPMAPMWEAMGRPVLPQLARAFAGQLRDGIEQAAGMAIAPRRPLGTRILAWLRRLFGKGEQTA